MEKTCPKRNILVCISVLAALNLGIVVIASQLPIPFLNFDGIIDQVNAQAKPAYPVAGETGYRFQSCTGGDSVNCHANGNRAGL